MRRQIIVILLFLFYFALPSAWGADRGALFKVSANGHTMHLYGTMHVGVPEFYPLEPRIAQAVAGASVLALEIDAGRDPAGMAKAVGQHGLNAPGTSLYQSMTQQLKQRLEKVLGRARIEPAAVTTFRPWLVATMLALVGMRTNGPPSMPGSPTASPSSISSTPVRRQTAVCNICR